MTGFGSMSHFSADNASAQDALPAALQPRRYELPSTTDKTQCMAPETKLKPPSYDSLYFMSDGNAHDPFSCTSAAPPSLCAKNFFISNSASDSNRESGCQANEENLACLLAELNSTNDTFGSKDSVADMVEGKSVSMQSSSTNPTNYGLSTTSLQMRTSTSVPNASVSEMSAPLQSPCVATADAEEDSHKHEEIIQRNVYISGLPSYMQSGEFRELCQRFGRVEASKLCVEGPSNPTKGYGFVLYYSEESATACIKGLSGSYLNGRCLQARLADTHATPHESKRRMQPRPPSPPPPPFAPPEHNAAERHRLMPHKVPSSGGNNDKMTLFNDDVSPKVVLPPPPPLPVQIVHPANAFLMNANSSATSAGTPTAAFSMAAQLIPGVGLADPSHATMQGMYYTCAPPLQAYQISPMSGGAEGQVVMLQPQPTIVYMAPSPYFTAAAATARTSRCAALPNSSFGQGTPTLPPLMLSSTPPAGVQIISLPSAPSALPM